MSRKFSPVSAFLALLASCSSLKPLTFENNKQASAAGNQTNKEIKFLDISSDNDTKVNAKSAIKEERTTNPTSVISTESNYTDKSAEIESSSTLKLKYSHLLNTEVQQIQNISLYRTIDEWYGTRL